LNAKARYPDTLPTKEELAQFINESSRKVGKREIIRAFNIRPEFRVELRRLLKELEEDGIVNRGRGKNFGAKGVLPNVAVITITGLDEDGLLLARPVVWKEDGEPPKIFLAPERQRDKALGDGDRVLSRLTKTDDGYEGVMIRKLESGPTRTIGVYAEVSGSGRILPTDKKQKFDFLVTPEDRGGAVVGDLVAAEIMPGKRLGLRTARVIERLGAVGDARAISLIAIHRHNIPQIFSREALEEADSDKPVRMDKKRHDMRDLPFVTVDGEDARDFDDAVFATPDHDRNNRDGWRIMVAIADVAYYVRPGSPLDIAARDRGNSCYFPDRVVPMLPEKLSNDLCSLREKVNRPVLMVEMKLDKNGNKLSHKFGRAMIKSAARLTYRQMQDAADGNPDEKTQPLLIDVVEPLYGAYAAVRKRTIAREPLELELPEMRITLDEQGRVSDIRVRERLDSHRLIEEFMILANVCAAETLERQQQPCMYRVHEEPDNERVRGLRDFLRGIGLNFTLGERVRPALFNRIIERTKNSENAEVVNQSILRAQSQARYSPENEGHFGLALERYAHFTSPIRRYSDLLVHRALIRGGKMGQGPLSDHEEDAFVQIGEQISATERRAMLAERECIDRYIASHLADKIDAEFEARVSGVTRAGLFIRVLENHADGLIPISSLGDDYYRHDERRQILKGDRTGKRYQLGDRIQVRLAEANHLTGGLIFAAVDNEPSGPPKPKAKKGKVKKDKKKKHRKKHSRR
jgi:ribonuclease R